MNTATAVAPCACCAHDPADAPPSKIPWRKPAVATLFAAASEAFELINEWNARPFGIDLHAPTINGIAPAEHLPMILALVAVLICGPATYKKGWASLKKLKPDIEALMAAAVTGAILIGQYAEAAMVMALFTLAESIESACLERARGDIKKLLSLAPETATVQLPDGSWAETDIRRTAPGSRVRVKPGERIALDGVILQGRSAVNQAPVTGESMPVEKSEGDTVYAGTINESGSFEFRVTAAADESTLARIIRAVEEAQTRRAPVQRFVERFAAIYTPAIFLAAAATAVIPALFTGSIRTDWIYTALVLLVIGCPCALVLSTPISIAGGLAAAARHGILIKGGVFLEHGRLLKRLALDKTGTLTFGKPEQTDFAAPGTLGADEVLSLAAGLAARSDHPVSRAVAEAAANRSTALPEVVDFSAVPGRGIAGVIGGKKLYLGNLRMAEELTLCPAGLERRIAALEEQGKSVVLLVDEQGVQGLFAVADTLKESSVEAVRELKKLGVRTVMLTGDNEHTARVVAEQACVDAFRANLLPEDKAEAVGELAREGRTGMVGDGINDAPALARADIGFAMAAAGTDTAVETADVALMDDDLRKIPRFIRLSKAVYAILMQNITLALGVKAAFFILAFTGLASMWAAVFADVGVCLLVVANGLRTVRQ
ncbi:MAG: cadmium-translocating P-type ATPase [Desulfovibrio sp.]|jgi:Cd2+/Zn2+-exporting ATPase|nr:cadmium-translocating P-type ATPase [Desulfovibrio sp.]